MLKMNYPGDVTEHLPGQVVGPDVANGFLVCMRAVWSLTEERTVGYFRPLSPKDFEKGFIDQYGFLRMPKEWLQEQA